MVDEHAEAPTGSRLELGDDAGEVVDAVHELDDDALDAQVVAPDLLDELGVVTTLDVDPRPARDARSRSLDGDRAARGPGRGPARVGEGGAGGGLRGSERHRGAVDEEARAEGEGLGATAAVLEVDDVHAAGLLDPHDGADPAGLDLLDDEVGLGRGRGRPAAARGTPVAAEHVGSVAIVGRHD